MTGIFRASNPYNNFLLIIYAFILKGHLLLGQGVPVETLSDGALYRLFVSVIRYSGDVSGKFFNIVALALLCMQAIYLNNIALKNRFYTKSNYLTGMAYLLITSLFEPWSSFSSVLVVNSIFIWIISRLCVLHNNNRPKSMVFNLGLAIGCAIFIYLPSIQFILLVFAGISIVRAFRANEWVICLLGLLTPVYFFGAWLFLSNNYLGFKIVLPHFMLPYLPYDKLSIAAYILISIGVLIGFIYLQLNMRRQVVQVRKQWQIVFFFTVIALSTLFINADKNVVFTLLFCIPFSLYLGGAFFYPAKKWMPFVLHWSFFLLAIASGYFSSYF